MVQTFLVLLSRTIVYIYKLWRKQRAADSMWKLLVCVNIYSLSNVGRVRQPSTDKLHQDKLCGWVLGPTSFCIQPSKGPRNLLPGAALHLRHVVDLPWMSRVVVCSVFGAAASRILVSGLLPEGDSIERNPLCLCSQLLQASSSSFSSISSISKTSSEVVGSGW